MNTTLELIEAIKRGEMIVLLDDEDRENEGDIILAAQYSTPEKVNFMIREARGLVCVALSDEKCEKLGLRLMVEKNESPHHTNFTLSVEAREGVSTGISAFDRSHTICTLARDNCTSDDLVSPGHIFPLRARKGGVIERAGHTEASVELMRCAGLIEVAVIVEIINDDGTMARKADLEKFAAKHSLKIGTIENLIGYLREM